MGYGILYVIGQLGLGGLEHQVYYLLKQMDRRGYRPALVVWHFREEDSLVRRVRSLGVPLHAFPENYSGLKKTLMLKRWVRRFRPAVVHSYTFYTNFAVFFAVSGTDSIGIGSVRSDFEWITKETGIWLGRLSGRWPRVQVFNSVAAANQARRSKSLFSPREALVVRNGLDLESFPFHPLPPAEEVQILGVGSLVPVKRWDRLLSAAAALKTKGLSFRIGIAGSGPLLASLERQVLTHRIGDCVKLLGPSQDVQTLLAESHFLVHTSDNEGCPNVIMEAMACGRAVVATAVGDVPDLVDEGASGFLISRDDHAGLVDRMARLISDRSLCWQMGQAGRAKAEREFSLDRLLAATLDAYKTAGWNGSGVARSPEKQTRNDGQEVPEPTATNLPS